MNILYTDFTLQNKSLDIYLAGCNGNPHCTNCHNPESWDFNMGFKYSDEYFNDIKTKIKDFDKLIDSIMIMGGEPLDQNKDALWDLLFDAACTHKKIWLFTRYDFSEIPGEILVLCDYVKCGRYIPELATEDNIQHGIKLASSNQYIKSFDEGVGDFV
jgi:anaerobic ribonucleoside-triphosphate reductase activating protein